MSKKLIAIDMDGTLIGDEGISKEDKAAMLDAAAAGHVVAIVSGRSHDSVLELLAEEGLEHLPVSGSNGAITIVDGVEIKRVTMPESLVRSMVEYLDGAYPYLIYTSGDVYSKPEFLDQVKDEFTRAPGAVGSPFESYEFMAEYSKNHQVQTFTDLNEIFEKQLDIFKIFVFLPDPNKKDICSEFMLSLPNVTLTSSYVDNISVSSGDGHKGTGLQALADHFQIPIEDTIAMGDNLNDLGMLTLAGMAIAMENAEPEVKEVAHFITKSNLESGVAYAIRTQILNG